MSHLRVHGLAAQLEELLVFLIQAISHKPMLIEIEPELLIKISEIARIKRF